MRPRGAAVRPDGEHRTPVAGVEALSPPPRRRGILAFGATEGGIPAPRRGWAPSIWECRFKRRGDVVLGEARGAAPRGPYASRRDRKRHWEPFGVVHLDK